MSLRYSRKKLLAQSTETMRHWFVFQALAEFMLNYFSHVLDHERGMAPKLIKTCIATLSLTR